MSAAARTTIPWWMLPVAGVAASIAFITRRVGDPDYWWHELTGQWIVQHGSLARADLYTYTVGGTPWTDHEYGSQLLFYGLRQLDGLAVTSVFFALVVWAGFWLLYARIRQRDHAPVVAAAALLLAAGAGFPIWGPRPQMFDFTFVALLLFWLERYLRSGSRAIYFLPVLTLVWANLHGGFVFAFFFLGLALVALGVRWLWNNRPRGQLLAMQRLSLVLLASVATSLITPWGPALFVYVWRTQFSSQLSGFVREWQSPDFHMLSMLPFLAMLLLVFIGMAWRRPRLLDLLLVVATAVVALRALLFIPIFIVTATPVLAWQWSQGWALLRERLRARSPALSSRALTGALAGLLLAITIASIGFAVTTLRGQAAATRANYPVAAADWLAAHPDVGTRMFNEYAWGGYLAYRFYPEHSRDIFIYGESELMGDDLLAKYVDINQVRSDWSRLLDSYRVDYVVFPVDTPLVSALEASSQWHRAYADSIAVIFVRSGGARS